MVAKSVFGAENGEVRFFGAIWCKRFRFVFDFFVFVDEVGAFAVGFGGVGAEEFFGFVEDVDELGALFFADGLGEFVDRFGENGERFLIVGVLELDVGVKAGVLVNEAGSELDFELGSGAGVAEDFVWRSFQAAQGVGKGDVGEVDEALSEGHGFVVLLGGHFFDDRAVIAEKLFDPGGEWSRFFGRAEDDGLSGDGVGIAEHGMYAEDFTGGFDHDF